jgi:hypothetical protein
LDSKADIYNRILGIRAAAAAGSDKQQDLLVKTLIADQSLNNEGIIGELIENFTPSRLTINDVLSLLEKMDRSETRFQYWIDRPLKETCLNKYSVADIILWIQGLLPLIKQPPLIERRHCEISQKYSWLLSISVLLAERLVKAKHPDALKPEVLEIISLAQIGTSYREYHWDKHSLAELVPKWPELNHALFWFDVTTERNARDKNREGRLIHLWEVGFIYYKSFWRFTIDDFETVLSDVRSKAHPDDRLLALSLALQLYEDCGREQARLNKLKETVQGVTELEEALNDYLRPAPISEQARRFQQMQDKFKRKREEQERQKSENRQSWIEWLPSNTNVLRDTSIAAEGKIRTATGYLIDELRDKRDDRNKWSVADWEELIPEFGVEVAVAFRDGCIEYWRKYKPIIRSEGIDNPNSVGWAIIVGLSGLKMEFRQEPNWPKNLTKDEADLACRYAFYEMNGFPEWIQKLHSVFPNIVEERILGEIEWEFSQYNGEERCHYVLSDVFWQLDWIKSSISERILSILGQYEPKHDNTVEEALGIVLGCPDCTRKTFAAVAKNKINRLPNGYRKALWLAGWMCIEAKGALQALKSVIGQIKDSAQATEFSMQFIVALIGERRERFTSEYQDYIRPEILLALIKLMYCHIRLEDDIHRAGGHVYSPGLRDDAQAGRSLLSERLRNIPGKATYLALLDLAKNHPNESMRARCLVHARRRAEEDAESEQWNPGDIAKSSRTI